MNPSHPDTTKWQVDDVVFGSGASGMTMALLLANAGHKVLVVEKSRTCGGAMQRFRRNGVPFDTGFHFSAGMNDCLDELLKILNLRQAVTNIPVRTIFYFHPSGHEYILPRGHRAVADYFCRRFPGEEAKIRAYFSAEREIFENTEVFDLKGGGSFFSMMPGDYDTISLGGFLDSLNIHGELRACLSAFSTCHGTPPSEISMASHCRVSYGLMDDLVRLKNGGESIVRGFLREAERLGIGIRTNCTVREFGACEKRQCHSLTLTDGSEVAFGNAVFSIHPREIDALLPREMKQGDFQERIRTFDETFGLFTTFTELTEDVPDFREELVCSFASLDIETIIARGGGKFTTALMLSEEEGADGKKHRCVTAFRTVLPDQTKAWEKTRTGHRPEEYYEYKHRMAEEALEVIGTKYPSFRGKLKVLDTASMLTYRDYLSPFGSAYGIRQKINQHNIFGRLPIRNFYAVGQNSLLPGAMGAMLSSVIIFRKLAGENVYQKLIRERLGAPDAAAAGTAGTGQEKGGAS